MNDMNDIGRVSRKHILKLRRDMKTMAELNNCGSYRCEACPMYLDGEGIKVNEAPPCKCMVVVLQRIKFKFNIQETVSPLLGNEDNDEKELGSPIKVEIVEREANK